MLFLQVGTDERTEYGSVQSWGSKKSNLNHLLNFHFEPYAQGGGGRGRYPAPKAYRGRGFCSRRSSYYNKERFLQAKYVFTKALPHCAKNPLLLHVCLMILAVASSLWEPQGTTHSTLWSLICWLIGISLSKWLVHWFYLRKLLKISVRLTLQHVQLCLCSFRGCTPMRRPLVQYVSIHPLLVSGHFSPFCGVSMQTVFSWISLLS